MGKRKLAASLIALIIIDDDEEKLKRKKRKLWVKSWIARKHLGMAENIMKELAVEDPAGFCTWLRMDAQTFETLIQKLSPLLQKTDTVMRSSIPVSTKLAVTLRFLATGESFDSLHRQFRLGKATVSTLIPDVCQAIFASLNEEFLSVPKNEEEWRKIAREYWDLWQFPHCIGALDGKHIVIESPAKSGSFYFNYKGSFSVVLMALVDADYKFIYVDVGTNGRVSDGGVWGKCGMKNAIEDSALNIPAESCHMNFPTPLPFVIIGDQGFGLKPYLMRPFPDSKQIDRCKRIFNYRLCRARRTSENAFGILASRFQVFRSPIRLSNTQNVSKIVLAAVTLHNFLRKNVKTRNLYSSPSSFDQEDLATGIVRPGDWRNLPSTGVVGLHLSGANHSAKANAIRTNFMNFFVSDCGSVSWQWDMI